MTNRDVVRKVVIDLKAVQERIPRSHDGDPEFLQLQKINGPEGPTKPYAVFDVFTAEQVVAMVNRYLYQAEYQQKSHRDYQERRRAFEKPIKEAAKRLFPNTSFINLTEQQLEAAIRAAHGKE